MQFSEFLEASGYVIIAKRSILSSLPFVLFTKSLTTVKEETIYNRIYFLLLKIFSLSKQTIFSNGGIIFR